MRSEGVTYTSASELRLAVRSLAPELSGIMEEVSTKVVLPHADEPTARLMTWMWLTNAIPEVQRALCRPDPLDAFVNAGAYVAQSTPLVTDGH